MRRITRNNRAARVFTVLELLLSEASERGRRPKTAEEGGWLPREGGDAINQRAPCWRLNAH